MPVDARPTRVATMIVSNLSMSLPPGLSRIRCRRWRCLLRSPTVPAPQDKPANALHNPVTLPVVCQLMLLRSSYGGSRVLGKRVPVLRKEYAQAIVGSIFLRQTGFHFAGECSGGVT